MSRIRYFDYQSPDSTILLNEWRRGILQPGVYFGYNAVPGSSGLKVSLDMDSDPDKSGGYLGTIITRDGVTIQETADLTDVATCPAAHASLPRIDLLVATYIYNAGLPNNDVTYEIVQGTAATNPVPPSVNDNQLILAQIHLAASQTTLSAGDVVDINRKNLYGQALFDNLQGIFRPGIYTGFLCKTGSTDDDTTVEAGSFLSNEYKQLNLASTQVDLFTHSSTTSAAYYRYDWIVAMHKYEDVEGNEDDIDYILVEGSEADESAGNVATPPSNSDILTAAQAVDPKYTSNDYINKLCLVRVQGTAGSMIKDYSHTPRLLLDTTWYVSGGSLTNSTQPLGQFTQYFPYQGPQGIVTALSTLRSLVEQFYGGIEPADFSEAPIKLLVDGNFNLDPDTLLGIPSFVEVCGISGAKFYAPEATHPVFSFGHTASTSLPSTTIISVLAADQSGVPGGYERWEIGFNGTSGGIGSYFGLSDYLVRTNFAGNAIAGDPIYVYDTTGGFLEGWFEQYTTVTLSNADDTFRVILPSAMSGSLSRLVMYKLHSRLKDVAIETKDATTVIGNFLSTVGCRECVIENVVAPALETSANNESTVFRNIRIDWGTGNWLTRDTTSNLFSRGGNIYDNIFIRPVVGSSADILLGRTNAVVQSAEKSACVSAIQVDLQFVPNSTVETQYRDSVIGSIIQLDGNNRLYLKGYSNVIQSIQSENPTGAGINDAIEVTGSNNTIGQMRIRDADPSYVVWTAGTNANTIGSFSGTNRRFIFADDTARQNYCLSTVDIVESASLQVTRGTSVRADDAPNFIITSNATITWSGGQLSFDDDIIVELPYASGRMVILSSLSPISLSDGDRIYLHIDRFATGDTNKTPTVVPRSNADSRRNLDELIIARREGSVLYWITGAVFTDGVTGTLDNAAPLDNSVTHPKLEATAKAYINDGLNPFFTVNPNVPRDLYDPEVLFEEDELTGKGAWSINTATGILSCGGMSSGDWEAADVGDEFIDADGYRFWILQVSSASWRLKPGADPNLTIAASEDDLTVGRGGGTWLSDRAYTVVADPSPQSGRVGYQITMNGGWCPKYVREGYIFIDSTGERFKIWDTTPASGIIKVNGATAPAAYGGGTAQIRAVTHNNPRGLSLMDTKPVFGVEILPIWGATRRNSPISWEPYYSRINADISDVYTSVSRNGPDPRILGFGVAVSGLHTTASISDAPRQVKAMELSGNVANGSASGIIVTAFMSNIAFLLSRITGSTPPRLIIDGATVETGEYDSPNLEIDTTSWDDRMWWAPNIKQLTNMAPGIHTVMLDSTQEWVVSGVVIINEPNHLNGGLSSSVRYTVPPGRLYADMTYWDYDVTFPMLASARGYRGGRVALQANADYTAKEWVYENIEERDDTGDTSTVSPTITSVTTPSQFVVGDIVRLTYASTAEKRVVTAVGATSIDVTPNPSISQVGAPIQWVGRTFLAGTSPAVHNLYHPNEEEIMTVPFYALEQFGPVSREYAWMGYDEPLGGGTPVERRAATFPDDMQFVMAYDIAFRPYAYWAELTTTTDYLRIGFIGTGIDLIFNPRLLGSSSVLVPFSAITLDGVSLGSGQFQATISSTEPLPPHSAWGPVFPDFGATETSWNVLIAQDLDYGFHTLEIEFNLASAVAMIGYTIYGPKAPVTTRPVFWEAAYLGDMILRPDGTNKIIDDSSGDGTPYTASGFLSVDPTSLLIGDDLVYNTRSSRQNSLVTRTFERGGIGHVVSDDMGVGDTEDIFLVFYGSAFMFEAEASHASIDLSIEAMDTDGQWKTLSNLDCAVVTGRFANPTVNIPTSPTRWWVHFFEGASYSTQPKPLNQLWLVKIGLDNAGGTAGANVTFRSTWLRQDTHLWQKEDNVGGLYNKWLVPRSVGRDSRILKASDVHSIPPPMWYYGADPSMQVRNQCMVILSEGEYWDIVVELNMTLGFNKLGIDLIWEDGIADTKVGNAANPVTMSTQRARWENNSTDAASTTKQAVLSFKAFLAPGWHIFSVNNYDTDTDDMTAGSEVYSGHYQVRASPSFGGSHSSRPLEATIPFIKNVEDL